MAGGLPPPPTRAASGDFAWTAWNNELYKLLSTTGAVQWSQVSKAGSSIADLQQKNHDLLSNVQGGAPGEHYHLTAAQVAAIGSGSSGTVTNIATGSGLTGGPITTTGTIGLATAYGDTVNPYGSKTANYVLAAPNGSSGAPTFRAIVAADIPTLNQNTTGTAANITATSNSTLTTLSALSLPYSQLSGTVPTWNQNTTGNAATATKATNIANGVAYQIPYQTAANTTAFISAPTTASTYLSWNGSAFTWGAVSATVNWASPGAIGSTTANTGKFTSLSFANATTQSNLSFNDGVGGLISSIGFSNGTGVGFGRNCYFDPTSGSGQWVYTAAGLASFIELDPSGQMTLVSAPAGIAGDAVPYTSSILLNSTGIYVPTFTSTLKSKSFNGGVGYATGAGSAVTQLTSKSTGVTLNNVCGQITMAATSLAANTSVSFTLTNSSIAATDVVIVNAANVAGAAPTANTYIVTVDSVLAGSCRIHVRNTSAAAAAQVLVLNFAVIKAVNA